ncbi:hypothetical protein EV714DRAFT_277887 [Schizophyllum commune]
MTTRKRVSSNQTHRARGVVMKRGTRATIRAGPRDEDFGTLIVILNALFKSIIHLTRRVLVPAPPAAVFVVLANAGKMTVYRWNNLNRTPRVFLSKRGFGDSVRQAEMKAKTAHIRRLPTSLGRAPSDQDGDQQPRTNQSDYPPMTLCEQRLGCRSMSATNCARRLLNVHHTPHAAHACIRSDFTELENGTLDHLAQSQLVRASSSSSATSTRDDIGEWVC